MISVNSNFSNWSCYIKGTTVNFSAVVCHPELARDLNAKNSVMAVNRSYGKGLEILR